ncbi:type IV secretion system protein [Bartonella machadoae]|uniref:type IV secretion system protein n=1 Tax=Bartonella machadoae TaxID=2893471 RepID=UPI002112B7DE|nr:type IV secretion system protein [Bartonella machadoae]
MKKLLLTTALCAISIGLKTNAFAMYPVFDSTAAANMAKQFQQGTQQLNKLQQQIQQGAQQLNQLKSQLDQMKQLYKSLNVKPDTSALQDMFNKQGSNGALPSDFNNFEHSINGTGGGGGGSKRKRIMKKNTIKSIY